jgi:hypothetical protein
VSIDVAKNFGHGGGFGVLPWLFVPIMYHVPCPGLQQLAVQAGEHVS